MIGIVPSIVKHGSNYAAEYKISLSDKVTIDACQVDMLLSRKSSIVTFCDPLRLSLIPNKNVAITRYCEKDKKMLKEAKQLQYLDKTKITNN